MTSQVSSRNFNVEFRAFATTGRAVPASATAVAPGDKIQLTALTLSAAPANQNAHPDVDTRKPPVLVRLQ